MTPTPPSRPPWLRRRPPSGIFFLQAVRDAELTGQAEPAGVRAVRWRAPKKAPAKRAPRNTVPKSVAAAAASGDRRQLLVALRNRIAQAIDDPKTTGPALAALIKQQCDIGAEIHAIDLAADAASSRSGPESAIATTPDEPWDESMI